MEVELEYINPKFVELFRQTFAYLPSKVPHAFLNLTDEAAEIIVEYTPDGGHKFYEELGPLMHSASQDKKISTVHIPQS